MLVCDYASGNWIMALESKRQNEEGLRVHNMHLCDTCSRLFVGWDSHFRHLIQGRRKGKDRKGDYPDARKEQVPTTMFAICSFVNVH